MTKKLGGDHEGREGVVPTMRGSELTLNRELLNNATHKLSEFKVLSFQRISYNNRHIRKISPASWWLCFFMGHKVIKGQPRHI